MPELMKTYIVSQMTESNYDNVTLENIKPPLPTILFKGDVYFLLYPVGGDSKIDTAYKIIDEFKKRKEKPWLFKKQVPFDYDYAYAFFYDADKKGVEERVNNIKKHFSDLLGNLEGLAHNEIITTGVGRIGCFVFSKDGNKGRLEDMLMPMMRVDNEEIFEDAQQYIRKHYDEKRLRRDDHFDSEKALIGVAGQLQRSGCSNTVIIQHTDYISKEKIKKNDQCGDICTFFNRFLKLHQGE